MKCAFCGKKLETTDKRIRYCSDECRAEAYRIYSKKFNKQRRQTNKAYREKTYEGNRRRYHLRKHERFIELAKGLHKLCGNVDGTVEFLEENFRLRH